MAFPYSDSSLNELGFVIFVRPGGHLQELLDQNLWKSLEPRLNPFLRFEFQEALAKSLCIGEKAGWVPVKLVSADKSAALISYVKSHSYGEYIFDWGWAQAYERSGLDYYPKLLSMIPFTPATTPHFLMKDFDQKTASELLSQMDQIYLQNELSSHHFLFLHSGEIELFKSHGFMIRESMQYHFFNQDYADFEHFLSFLKSKKAKHIREERIYSDIKIERLTGTDLTQEHALRMFQFYLSTIDKKHSYDYLNEEFFVQIFTTMPEQILYVEASQNNQKIAGSLFFYDEERLYGRYWGSNTFVQNLHFELCYYQGIDFCLEKKLKVFEAGAQGEHKIQRGFRPVRTYSAHKIKHQGFARAIGEYIKQEKLALEEDISYLEKRLPFKI